MTDNFRSFVLPSDDPTGATYFDDVPLGRAGEPDEVGRTCVFPCSGEADYINGTTIEIDGGMLPGVLYEAGLETIIDLLQACLARCPRADRLTFRNWRQTADANPVVGVPSPSAWH